MGTIAIPAIMVGEHGVDEYFYANDELSLAVAACTGAVTEIVFMKRPHVIWRLYGAWISQECPSTTPSTAALSNANTRFSRHFEFGLFPTDLQLLYPFTEQLEPMVQKEYPNSPRDCERASFIAEALLGTVLTRLILGAPASADNDILLLAFTGHIASTYTEGWKASELALLSGRLTREPCAYEQAYSASILHHPNRYVRDTRVISPFAAIGLSPRLVTSLVPVPTYKDFPIVPRLESGIRYEFPSSTRTGITGGTPNKLPRGLNSPLGSTEVTPTKPRPRPKPRPKPSEVPSPAPTPDDTPPFRVIEGQTPVEERSMEKKAEKSLLEAERNGIHGQEDISDGQNNKTRLEVVKPLKTAKLSIRIPGRSNQKSSLPPSQGIRSRPLTRSAARLKEGGSAIQK